MTEDMRGLFFIAKGQYKKGVSPTVDKKDGGGVMYLGGYDPYSTTTTEWYIAMDTKTFNCISCGKDLNTVLKGIYNTIRRYKGVAKNYYRYLSTTTTEDYYNTHYLGAKPLTPTQKKKEEGKCVGSSPHTKDLFGRVYEEFGDFFNDLIEEVEDKAYKDLKEDTPFHKSKKLVKKQKEGVVMTKKKEEKSVPHLKVLKTKTIIGIKKIK